MPLVHIRIGGTELRPDEIETLQKRATQLMASVMRKKAELTAVLVETHDMARWSIDGQPVPYGILPFQRKDRTIKPWDQTPS